MPLRESIVIKLPKLITDKTRVALMRQRNSVIKTKYGASFEVTRGMRVFVCIEDLAMVLTAAWHVSQNHSKGKVVYYAVTSYRQKMHRVLTNAPVNKIVDHEDGNGLNNRRNNLRICDHFQNHGSRSAQNAHKLKGIAKENRTGKWYARIAGRHLGTFLNANDAARAYDIAARKYYGQFARTNFHAAERDMRDEATNG